MAAKDTDSRSILIVDDSAMNRMLLEDIVGDEYNIIEAEDGLVAIQKLEESADDIMLVLLDINMPNMNGFEVLDVMNQRNWIQDIPVIMISSEDSIESIERTYDLGVTDYITRPFSAPVVLRRVNNAIKLYDKQRRLADMVTSQIYEKQKNTNLLVNILSHIVEFRNGESGLHILHIGTLTDVLLRELAKKTEKYDLTPSRRALITTASALHDIGKIAIDADVLNKPGRLTDEEFEHIKQHTTIGYDMLTDIPIGQGNELVEVARQICRWHHERYDGRGYPDGLEGDDIPISAQVVALADVYDALTSERCYKPAFTHEKALEMIVGGECGTFSPALLECLVEAQDDIQREMAQVSFSDESDEAEFKRLLTEIKDNSDLSVLNNAFDLLEGERQKYDFTWNVSDDLQFDYVRSTNTLNLSPNTAKTLGLPTAIQNPLHSAELAAIFGKDNLRTIFDKMRASQYGDPSIQAQCTYTLDGQEHKGLLTVQVIWSQNGEDGPTMRGALAKLLPVKEAVPA